MIISLRVDHYIYKNKPISAADATSYYLEVMSFQTVCKHDKRSLQVIEKLSRFMQAIIKEQTSNNLSSNNNSFINDDNNEQLSPVYSLTEDDKYEFEMINRTQNQDLNHRECEKINQYDIGPIIEVNKNEMCSSEYTGTKESLDEKMAEALVDLTIVNDETKDVFTGNEMCSQSSLDVPYLNTTNVQNFYNEQCGQDTNEVDRAVYDLNKETEIATTRMNTNKMKFVKDTKVKINNIQAAAEINPTTLNGEKELVGLKNVNLIKKKKSKNVELGKKQKKQQQRHARTPSSTLASHKTVYANSNSTYETDLSWIEKIKFVREINKDECDPSLAQLGESLWENCELPISWEDFE